MHGSNNQYMTFVTRELIIKTRCVAQGEAKDIRHAGKYLRCRANKFTCFPKKLSICLKGGMGVCVSRQDDFHHRP